MHQSARDDTSIPLGYGAADQDVCTLVYQSRATAPLDDGALTDLVANAQHRNKSEDLTGLVIYDRGRFVQWLEGPRAGLERVAASIGEDPRHHDIRIHTDSAHGRRVFSGWDMRLAMDAPTCGAEIDPMRLPPDFVAALLDSDAPVPEMMAALAPRDLSGIPSCRPATPRNPARDSQDAVVATMRGALSDTIAHLVTEAPAPEAEDGGLMLARLLAADDTAAADALAAEICTGGDPISAAVSLFESTAEALGELWVADSCDMLDVALALCRMQSMLRQMGATAPLPPLNFGSARVLAVPMPGEEHHLASVLAAEALYRTGSDVTLEFPADDAALGAMLAAESFDLLHIAMSPAFRRDERLPRLTETIAAARRAARDPELMVIAAGRAFVDAPDSAKAVGADAAQQAAATVPVLVRTLLARREKVSA